MSLQKTEGIVLRYYDYGDTSRIVVLLTKNFGKLKVMAKGLKSKKSPMQGRLELFYVVEILFYQNPSGDLHTLKEVSTLKVFPGFHDRLIAFAAASYLVELAQVAVPGEEQEEGLYPALLQAIDSVAQEGGDWELALRWFETQLIQEMGQLPRLNHCAACRKELKGSSYMTPVSRGLLCEGCVPSGAPALPLSATVPQVLTFFSQVELDKVSRVKLSPPQRVELKKVLRNFLDFVLERRLKSSEFLDKLTAPAVS